MSPPPALAAGSHAGGGGVPVSHGAASSLMVLNVLLGSEGFLLSLPHRPL